MELSALLFLIESYRKKLYARYGEELLLSLVDLSASDLIKLGIKREDVENKNIIFIARQIALKEKVVKCQADSTTRFALDNEINLDALFENPILDTLVSDGKLVCGLLDNKNIVHLIDGTLLCDYWTNVLNKTKDINQRMRVKCLFENHIEKIA